MGFYDQNILTPTDEHKKRRSELIEKEFNKVFDSVAKQTIRHDEEPAKPKILPSYSIKDDAPSSPLDIKYSKSFKITSPKLIDNKNEEFTEDSLSIAEKEIEL